MKIVRFLHRSNRAWLREGAVKVGITAVYDKMLCGRVSGLFRRKKEDSHRRDL
jgi:hypothetical protein